jgi:hypothetical protein
MNAVGGSIRQKTHRLPTTELGLSRSRIIVSRQRYRSRRRCIEFFEVARQHFVDNETTIHQTDEICWGPTCLDVSVRFQWTWPSANCWRLRGLAPKVRWKIADAGPEQRGVICSRLRGVGLLPTGFSELGFVVGDSVICNGVTDVGWCLGCRCGRDTIYCATLALDGAAGGSPNRSVHHTEVYATLGRPPPQRLAADVPQSHRSSAWRLLRSRLWKRHRAAP